MGSERIHYYVLLRFEADGPLRGTAYTDLAVGRARGQRANPTQKDTEPAPPLAHTLPEAVPQGFPFGSALAALVACRRRGTGLAAARRGQKPAKSGARRLRAAKRLRSPQRKATRRTNLTA